MHEYSLLLRPPPPPRPTGHVWLGILLSGLVLGVGAFYAADLRRPAHAQVVLDLNPRSERIAATNGQIQQLVGDIKGLMAELKRTQHALAQAQTRIAALERENQTLRSALTAFDPEPLAELSTPSSPKTLDGLGGPFVEAPAVPETESPEPEIAAAAPRSGPRACWMREGTMISTYRIAIRDDGFVLRPTWTEDGEAAWPAEFGQAMAGFRGKPHLSQEAMSRREFMRAMQPYYDFGMEQEGRCRFLVAVVNETTGRETWNAGIELVERYFFKMIRTRGSGDLAFNAAQQTGSR